MEEGDVMAEKDQNGDVKVVTEDRTVLEESSLKP